MLGSINEQLTKITMNYLYNKPGEAQNDPKFLCVLAPWRDTTFFLCFLRFFVAIVLCGKKEVNQQMKKMQNEPNFAQLTSSIKYPESRKKCKTNPIYTVFRPKTTIMKKNEPNSTSPELACTEYHRSVEGFCKTNPIQTQFINEQRTMNNELFSNEPNLQTPQINLNFVKTKDYMKNYAFALPKNEPNLRKTNPILSKGLSIVRFEQNMQNEPNLQGDQVPHFYNEQRTINNQQISNEPNLKNTKINLTSLYKMIYAIFRPSAHRKNEPNFKLLAGKQWTENRACIFSLKSK